MTQCLFASDLHGRIDRYEKPFAAIEERWPAAVFLGGDLLPFPMAHVDSRENLQDDFDAVMHYDLSWNPTRHEQREGRVDRFGQPRDTVPVITYFGTDNQIDGVVLDVLLRKHRKIKSDWNTC